MRIAAELIATGRASHAWLGAQVSSDIATRGASIIDVVKQRPPQPETVTALLPRLHVENASAMRPVDALRAWLRDNIPSTALPVSMRRLRNPPRPAARMTTNAKQRA